MFDGGNVLLQQIELEPTSYPVNPSLAKASTHKPSTLASRSALNVGEPTATAGVNYALMQLCTCLDTVSLGVALVVYVTGSCRWQVSVARASGAQCRCSSGRTAQGDLRCDGGQRCSARLSSERHP
eukprot:4130864-Amphidinium_carterae.1